MDHDLIGEQVLDRCKGLIENMLLASDLHNVGCASVVIFAQMRREGWEILKAHDHAGGLAAPKSGCLLHAVQRPRDVCPHPDGESEDLIGADDHSRSGPSSAVALGRRSGPTMRPLACRTPGSSPMTCATCTRR